MCASLQCYGDSRMPSHCSRDSWETENWPNADREKKFFYLFFCCVPRALFFFICEAKGFFAYIKMLLESKSKSRGILRQFLLRLRRICDVKTFCKSVLIWCNVNKKFQKYCFMSDYFLVTAKVIRRYISNILE